MKRKKNGFQDRLKKQIFLYTIIIIIILLVLFFLSMLFYDYTMITRQTENVNRYLIDLFMDTYSDYENFLISAANNENFQNYIIDRKNQVAVYNTYYSFNKNWKIKSNIVLTDSDGNIIVNTFPLNRNNNHFISFNNMIREKVQNSKKMNSIETGLYSFIELTSEYVISGPIIKDEKIIGFVMLYMSGDDWNYELSAQEFNGIITDRFGNVIASSSKMIVNNMNKFEPKSNNDRIKISGTEYILRHSWLQEQDINIYSLFKVKMYFYQYLLGAIIILILGLSMFIITEVFSKKIAANTAQSINKLINQIYIIKKGNLNYKINLNTGDEIEVIAESVNDLVKRINDLINRNTELINTRRISEIKQLEAQFNPHFMYNTLETIRYSILLDPKIASDLTSLLTKILRYSISKGANEVKFGESLEYTMVFLKIYKYRFNKNFDYAIDISDECNDVYVPKLLLQPIIENSIKYGYKEKANIRISISARLKDSHLIIVVEDDGAGIPESELISINRSLREETANIENLGLYNTSRMLLLQYGNESGLHLESKINEGTRVIINIKVDKNNKYQYEGDDSAV